MANPFSKGWKYLTASLDQKIEENADPLVQIQQASEAAKRQHQQVREQATQVIGNRNQLEMKLNRLVGERDELEKKARQALSLAEGEQDSARASELQQAAEIYATQLVGVEQELENAKTLHSQASSAADEATRQLQQSEARLKDQMAQIDQLRSQVQQTKMQEASAATMDQIGSMDPDRDVPSLDQVREKIERRYAQALGSQELTEHSMQDRMAEIESSAGDMRAQARLEQIRAELSAPESAKKEIES
ncbi:PspA/IM30 family protein [Corynebacterium gerontici]|uniref:PspA/IM30 family protein n=1 Tax=Corynebacterium gerontici TaxID=2079234 RepID=A0A3G6IXU9_9CORY|nr:PspA/IM30 family protein [Corynebacterium gerontici]AZA10466.1 PspA/IM30 family protein [Corynebacterium gerontici]